MKNISRRVFIKGMAVAAAATAASTVLAGCKLTPEVEEVPAPVNNSLSFVSPADEDKKLTITANGMTVSDGVFKEDTAAVELQIDNKLSQNLYIVNADADAKTVGVANNTFYVLVSAYANGRTGNGVTVSKDTSAGSLPNSLVYVATHNATPISDKANKIGNIILDYTGKDYSSITLKVEVKEVLNSTTGVVRTVAKQEFTYNV